MTTKRKESILTRGKQLVNLAIEDAKFHSVDYEENGRKDIEFGNESTSSDDVNVADLNLARPLMMSRLKKKIAPERTKKPGKRKNCCPFCNKLVTNFGRHLTLKHNKEKEVKDYIATTDEDKKLQRCKRAAIANKLRKLGNYNYNLRVSKDKCGELLPLKSPSAGYITSVNTHVTCKNCLGFYKKECFYLHINNCVKIKPGSKMSKPLCKSSALQSHASLLIPEMSEASELLKNDVLPVMNKDHISVVAQSDSLILKYGSRFYQTHKNSVKYTCTKMRSLARLLIKVKTIKPEIQTMTDCLKPENFDCLMEAIRILSKYDDKTGDCLIPGVVPPLCGSLKTCCSIVRSETIKNSVLSYDDKKKIYIMLDGFEHLMKKEWAQEVSTIAERSRKKMKVNKNDIVPKSEDIRAFWDYLDKKCESAVESLINHPSAKNHDNLAKILIGFIITLNRRRPGEVCLATLENYLKVNENNDFGVLDETILTKEEKMNCKDLSIFYIAASKNRKKVPVMLTSKMKQSIDVLVNSRQLLKIKSHLLFARASNDCSFEGCDILRDLKKDANLLKPEHFTATGLRHHAATSSQLHHRDDTYTKRLAKFLGHDLKTHEGYYEMPLPIVQKGKVGTKLLQMIMPKEELHVRDESTCGNDVPDSNDDGYRPPDSSSEEESCVSTPKKKCRRVRWSREEKEVIYKHFGRFFLMKEAPERKEIKKVFDDEPTLKNRTLQQVCTYVNNIVTDKLKIPTPIKNKIRKNFLKN